MLILALSAAAEQALWVLWGTLGSLIGASVWLAVRWRKHARRRQMLAAEWPAGFSLKHRRVWVRQRVEYWWVAVNRAHEANIPDTPEVEFSERLRHALGWADSSRNLIKISEHHLMEKSKQVADETVAHEVAHIFADRYHNRACRHGRLWKDTMEAIGQEPEVCYQESA